MTFPDPCTQPSSCHHPVSSLHPTTTTISVLKRFLTDLRNDKGRGWWWYDAVGCTEETGWSRWCHEDGRVQGLGKLTLLLFIVGSIESLPLISLYFKSLHNKQKLRVGFYLCLFWSNWSKNLFGTCFLFFFIFYWAKMRQIINLKKNENKNKL